MRKRVLALAVAIPTLCLIMAFAYTLPPIHDRLSWRVDNWRAQIKYALNPPEQVVFVPQSQDTRSPQDTLPPSPTPSPLPTATPTQPGPTVTPPPSPTPLPSPTPIPDKASLKGIIHEYQKWNNCGPANLAMDLSFWKWQGSQQDTAAILKPNPRDKNVMPYEMVSYVNDQTDLRALSRVGGDLQMLKNFIAAGFPIIVEKGFEGASFDGWMGHYEVISAYDDSLQRFTAQDSYLGPNLAVSYDSMLANWRAFNYTYIVVYPPEQEKVVMQILGTQADETANEQYAAQKASDEIFATTGRDQFFAWYNRGSSLVALQDYAGAADAYDKAFALYPSIPEKQRPWRMLWYQTGPYFAYFYTGRYYDVLNLADTTIKNVDEPAIEESFYWRAMTEAALGDTSDAITDYKTSLEWHPDFGPTLYQLQLMGVEP